MQTNNNHTSTNEKLAFIDAVRGWAILLVITSHVGGRFAELPYPIKKLTNAGWSGVQLFFLASAVTLLMSWHREKNIGWDTVNNFFIRRYLRIAPMYYFGALFYFLADPPASGGDFMQLMRSFLFVNVWHPDWVPTTPGWTVVPGGWSIGVEFTFYAIFPILALTIISKRRAIGLIAATVLIAVVANHLGARWLAEIAPVASDNFLYFWFFNQAPFFALGFLLYQLLSNPPRRLKLFLETRNRCYFLLFIIATLFVIAAEHPSASHLFSAMHAPPTVFFLTLLFMVLILIMGTGAPTLLVHPWIQRMGVVSFSAYILHFIFVKYIPVWCSGLIDPTQAGWHTIVMSAALWVLTVLATFGFATLTHRLIEQPGINLARRIILKRRCARADAHS